MAVCQLQCHMTLFKKKKVWLLKLMKKQIIWLQLASGLEDLDYPSLQRKEQDRTPKVQARKPPQKNLGQERIQKKEVDLDLLLLSRNQAD
ncbi:hypothetical protein WA026_021506 [Henosepilachna vigintioctopunctata]|uniref:Uncharacterized protein n=1 Tax=Henosepilachna vigintioctopunctata TaxID=420089 RepID=A0AAW1VI98_9CUCU